MRRLITVLGLLIIMLAACSLTASDEDEATPTLDSNVAQAADNAPTVTINSPVDGSEVSVGSEILVFSVARDDIGVTRVELRQDNILLNAVDSPDPAGLREMSVLQTWQPLETGQQTLQVIAYRDALAGEPAEVTISVLAQTIAVQSPIPLPTVVVPVPTNDPTCRARVNVTGLSMRAAPGFNTGVIRTLNIGDAYTVVGRTADNVWYEISRENQRGWVRSVYTSLLGNCANVSITGEVAQIPTATPSQTPTVTPTATATIDPLLCRAQILSGGLPAYSTTSTSGSVVSSLALNSEYQIVQRTSDGAWWQISLQGLLAWVSAGEVAIRGDCSSVLVATASPSPNQFPTISTIPAQVLDVNEGKSVPITAIDPDGDSLVIVVNPIDPTVVRAALESQNSISLLARQPGQTSVTVTVSDADGGVASISFDVTVNQIPNEPPTLAAFSDRSLDVGEILTIPVTTSDPEGRTPILSATSSATTIAVAAPDGAGNVTVRGVTAGEATITVVADDLSGGRAQQSFVVTVSELPTEVAAANQPPTISPISDQTVLEGESITVAVIADDPEGFNITIAEVRSGDENTAQAESDGVGGIIVTGVSAGQVDVRLTVEDGQGGEAETTFRVVVEAPTEEPNEPPTITPISDQTVLEGESITVAVIADDPEGFNVTIAEVRSGDENTAQAESDGVGGIIVTGVSAGQVDVRLTVEDGQGGEAETTFRVVVEAPTEEPNEPPTIETIADQTVLEGESITVAVIADDPEGFNVTIAEVLSGDENTAQVQPDGVGGLIVTGVSVGQVDVRLTVEDGQGGEAETTFRVVVEAPTEEPNEPPTIETIPPQTVMAGDTIAVPLVMADPEGFNPFVQTARSGSDAVATVAPDGAGNLLVTGVSLGQVDIQLTISDGQGGTARTVFRVVVEVPTEEPNEPPTIDPIADQEVMLGETVTVAVNASDPEGFNPFLSEVLSSAAEIAQAVSDGQGNILVTGVSPGTVQVRVTVGDSQGGRVSTSFGVVVTEPTVIPNDPPTIEAIEPQTLEAGTSITVEINANDPEGTNVTLRNVTSGSTAIAIAQSDGVGGVTVTGMSAGQVDVEVIIADGDGLTATTTFRVVVEESTAPNLPPAIQPLEDITLEVDEIAEIPVNANDPEGFNPFIAAVDSAADTIATVSVENRILTVVAVSPGQTTITVTVDDGNGATATAAFVVTVSRPPENQPPIVTPIEDLTIEVDEQTTIPVQATDPEGFNPFLASVESAAETIVIAESDGVFGITITGVSPGTATVTFVVGDSEGGETASQFVVTVPQPPTEVPNLPPIVEPIPDQVIGVGQTVKVFVIARDPEGANLFLGFVESPAETIATAQSDGQGNVDVTGVSPGEVTISLSVADNVENETPVFFTVRVEGAPEGQPNEAPNIQPVSNKTIALDTFLPVPLVASDPEGGEVTLNASSADEAVATVQIQDGNAMVYGAGEGQTAITITAIDGQGNTASLIFSVTVTVEVAEPPPAGDTPPELPIIADNLQQNAQAIFASANNSADRFIVVGDATPADLLGDAGDGFADLSPAPDLQATLDTYLNQPADDGNILNQGGARASNADWLLADLLNPANNAPDCADAPHPLACSVAIQTPSVAVMIVGRNDIAQGTPLDAFEADLNRAVDELVARGVIPVLATIPGDAAVTDPYNQIIIRVADENVIPLWNLNAAIPAEQVNADLTLSAPEATQNVNLTLADSFGAVKRNLQLLQILQSLRENVLVN